MEETKSLTELQILTGMDTESMTDADLHEHATKLEEIAGAIKLQINEAKARAWRDRQYADPVWYQRAQSAAKHAARAANRARFDLAQRKRSRNNADGMGALGLYKRCLKKVLLKEYESEIDVDGLIMEVDELYTDRMSV